jgi:outer membrane protein
MKSVFYAFTCLIALVLIATPVSAAETIKVGVVDIQEFQNKSKAFQKIKVDLKKKFDALQQKLDQEKAALIKLEEEFKKQGMMLSLDAKEDKKRELEKKSRYYKYLYEDLTDEMKDAEVEATKRVGKELEKVVEKIGGAEGYTVILEKRTLGLVYFNSAIDITARVTEAYDRAHQ